MLSQILHPIEKKIIKVLQQTTNLTPEKIELQTSLSPDQLRRGIEWLKLKGLADVKEAKEVTICLGKNGLEALAKGLPERKLVNEIREKPKTFEELKKIFSDSEFNAAIANAKTNDWIQIEKGESSNLIALKGNASKSKEERFLKWFGTGEKPLGIIKDQKTLESLRKRPEFIQESSINKKTVSLTDKGQNLAIPEELQISEEVHAVLRPFDVEAAVPVTFVARINPLKEVINEVREVFVSLGFSEVIGPLAQPSFWNFDALFTPQDHPAREMQDSFYLKDMNAIKFAMPTQIKRVSSSHKRGWRYDWSLAEAKRIVLRTHTTCVTIKYLAENKPDEARIFSLGRVFRNEKVSYKHLSEFTQVEGIVVAKDVTLRDLMGIQQEFYRKMGLTKIKFWPTFFPYTEPSLQSIVYNERLNKWVELFGMGIFRPEVTKPLGITKPVLAWGGGIERIAMLKYGLDDVREFYNNNLNWLRSVTKCP